MTRPRTRAIAALLSAAATALLAAALLGWGWARHGTASAPGGAPRGSAPPLGSAEADRGPLDVTFLVGADTHFGATTRLGGDTLLNPASEPIRADLTEVNRAIVEQMNAIVARPYPADLGGTVAAPRGLLLAGDLTEDGKESEWQAFERLYGREGTEGLLRMPVFAVIGNHDKNRGDRVARALEERHGGPYYAWQWGRLLLIALSEGPDQRGLAYLRAKLAEVGRARPVVVLLHFSLLGPFSRGQWFGDGDYREELAAAIAGYRIIAIFHGHFHGSGHYRWHGHDVYNVGSPKHSARSFAVVHVTDRRLAVSSWNVEGGFWWWWHSKSIDPKRHDRAEVLGTDRGPGGLYRPSIPYPVGR